MYGREVASSLPQHLQPIVSSATAGMLNGIVFSAIVSFFQWLVLRKYLSNSLLWIPICVIGNTIFAILNSSAAQIIIGLVGGAVKFDYLLMAWQLFASPFWGLFCGLFEWTVLRKELPKATHWIWARIAGTTLNGMYTAPVVLIGSVFHSEAIRFITNSGIGIANGIVLGVITGFILFNLIKERDKAKEIEDTFRSEIVINA